MSEYAAVALLYPKSPLAPFARAPGGGISPLRAPLGAAPPLHITVGGGYEASPGSVSLESGPGWAPTGHPQQPPQRSPGSEAGGPTLQQPPLSASLAAQQQGTSRFAVESGHQRMSAAPPIRALFQQQHQLSAPAGAAQLGGNTAPMCVDSSACVSPEVAAPSALLPPPPAADGHHPFVRYPAPTQQQGQLQPPPQQYNHAQQAQQHLQLRVVAHQQRFGVESSDDDYTPTGSAGAAFGGGAGNGGRSGLNSPFSFRRRPRKPVRTPRGTATISTAPPAVGGSHQPPGGGAIGAFRNSSVSPRPSSPMMGWQAGGAAGGARDEALGVMRPASAPPRQSGGGGARRVSAASVQRGPCNNCGATETSLWRRDPRDSSVLLCNPCGIYLRHNKRDRPTNGVFTTVGKNGRLRVVRRFNGPPGQQQQQQQLAWSAGASPAASAGAVSPLLLEALLLSPARHQQTTGSPLATALPLALQQATAGATSSTVGPPTTTAGGGPLTTAAAKQALQALQNLSLDAAALACLLALVPTPAAAAAVPAAGGASDSGASEMAPIRVVQQQQGQQEQGDQAAGGAGGSSRKRVGGELERLLDAQVGGGGVDPHADAPMTPDKRRC